MMARLIYGRALTMLTGAAQTITQAEGPGRWASPEFFADPWKPVTTHRASDKTYGQFGYVDGIFR